MFICHVNVLKGTGKRGHIVADTLLLMMFLGLRKLGNICCGHKMFLNKIRNIFVSRTQNLLKVLANEDILLRTHCCYDVSWAAQTGKHLLRTQNVSEQNQEHFCVPDTKFLNKCCARGQTGKHLCRQQCVRNNVSSFASTLSLTTWYENTSRSYTNQEYELITL